MIIIILYVLFLIAGWCLLPASVQWIIQVCFSLGIIGIILFLISRLFKFLKFWDAIKMIALFIGAIIVGIICFYAPYWFVNNMG